MIQRDVSSNTPERSTDIITLHRLLLRCSAKRLFFERNAKGRRKLASRSCFSSDRHRGLIAPLDVKCRATINQPTVCAASQILPDRRGVRGAAAADKGEGVRAAPRLLLHAPQPVVREIVLPPQWGRDGCSRRWFLTSVRRVRLRFGSGAGRYPAAPGRRCREERSDQIHSIRPLDKFSHGPEGSLIPGPGSLGNGRDHHREPLP